MFLSVLAPCVTLVLLVYHPFIVKGEKYVYVLNRKATRVIWTYYVSKKFHDCIIFEVVL